MRKENNLLGNSCILFSIFWSGSARVAEIAMANNMNGINKSSEVSIL